MSFLIPDISLSMPVADIPATRLDSKAKAALEKLGLKNVEDLIGHFPSRHENRKNFDVFPTHPTEQAVCLCGEIDDCQTKFAGKGRRYFEMTVKPSEDSVFDHQIACRWFNMPYMSKMFLVGQQVVLFGRPKMSGRRLVMDHPDYEIVDEGGKDDDFDAHMGRIVPVYPMASGISQKPLRTLIYRVLQSLSADQVPDTLPRNTSVGDMSRFAAIQTLHYPETMEAVEPAKRYLALEEFTWLQMNLLRKKKTTVAAGGVAHCGPGGLVKRYLEALPFDPTGAQSRVIAEIRGDLDSERPMTRLLQGDVGAGKTLVAAAAALYVIEAGFDAALMAPTQILAEQHYQNFQQWFEPLGIEVRLQTGSKDTGGSLPLFDTSPSDSPLGTMTVGTHALIHRKEGFENGLGLAIIDEQHKFGVGQRQALVSRGDRPDLLVMTATPIPRTLTLSFYGDLDVSKLDELPKGRGKIITGIRTTDQTEKAAGFLRDQLEEGRQIYIVYPLIEESEKIKSGAVTKEFKKWEERLKGYKCALLHGKMPAEEKDTVMEKFRANHTDVLVSTTVIEVGVDVPNANVMLIYNAERFGLAQLHQLRGRIGRGEHKSYCVLMCDPEAVEAIDRLRIMEQTRDGFLIAEEDLKQRGPGEVLGTQQSGLPGMKFPEYLGDSLLVEEARQIASALLDS
ncbi:MAG: ATP-dependent DNA helicase RecG [Verrucomicrobiales bacterium]|nr:ATP-dependent DNA helicase RecG [Verrucomicrobiales bacterium]